jgi:hypothetical protein
MKLARKAAGKDTSPEIFQRAVELAERNHNHTCSSRAAASPYDPKTEMFVKSCPHHEAVNSN